jgi:hypothetical protein
VDQLLPELAGRRVLKRLEGPLDDTGPPSLEQASGRTPGVGVRREIVWLPERNTDPNSRIENSAEATFSMVLAAR